MQHGNMAGREWIQIKAFLSIYWEDKEDLEQNIHLVIKIPGEFAKWGGPSSRGLLLLTRVVSPIDLSFKLADVEVWCYFLFLICCLKTSHISESREPTLDGLMFKEFTKSAMLGEHFNFPNCRKQLIQEQKSTYRSPNHSSANETQLNRNITIA